MPFRLDQYIQIPRPLAKAPAALMTIVPRSRLARVTSGLLLSLAGVYSYQQLYDTDIELIHNQGAKAREWINALGESVTGKYTASVWTPMRFMEIIYGNMFDTRVYCNYQREVMHLHDGENIALGDLTRLAQSQTAFN